MNRREDNGRFAPEGEQTSARTPRGILAYLAKNSVAANILMVFLLVGGIFKIGDIKQEVFPEFDLDLIVIRVPYPGASPAEVEQGVLLATEEAVRGIDGVKKVLSTATENFGVTVVQLLLGTDTDQALNDIKAAVDRVTTYPDDVERPTVFMARNRFQVISLAIYGYTTPKVLKSLAEKVRDDLLQDPRITVVELAGVRPLEISIEVPQEELRRYNLTLDQVANLVRAASIELPGGAVKTRGGEILLRTAERRDAGYEFEDIAVVSRPDGSKVRLGDIATIKDGFAETDLSATYGGKPAVMINVFRVGEQTPLDISDAVKSYIEEHQALLPPGLEMATWFDSSEFYEDRLYLLLENAAIGLVLVVLVLGVFLEIKLALWVTLGIPISFIGALLFLPSTGVSINMISLFAFIVVLGMVVDDAIVVGEAIYRRRQEGMDRVNAAIYGAKEVAAPVIFAILTTMIYYAPMLFVPGVMGKFFRVVPIVVIIVLAISLVESLMILPAHLAHSKESKSRALKWLDRRQQTVSRLIERMIQKWYVPVVAAVARRRYLALSLGIAVLFASCGLVAGGRVQSTFFPDVDGDVITANVELPYGTPVEKTEQLRDLMLDVADELFEENGGKQISRGVFAMVGFAAGQPGDPAAAFREQAGGNLLQAMVYLVEADSRPIGSAEFAREWEKRTRERFAGIDKLTMNYGTGPTAGRPIDIELNLPDMARLELAAQLLAQKLEDFAGVYEIDDGVDVGKTQLDLELKPAARALGLSELDLARQVRAAFFGAEAVRQQRGRDELKVYVRLPEEERRSEYNIEELIIRSPMGGEMRLGDAAILDRGRSYTSIQRVDGRRAIRVTADVSEAEGNAGDILKKVTDEVLPEMQKEFPGLRYVIGGEAQEQQEANASLLVGFGLAMLAAFALLAIAFRSYIQPLIIFIAIPFGAVGAILGHLVMGFSLSLMSMMGIVALAGVVVNDSLILIVGINRFRERGMDEQEAVVAAGALRFRPIILTSLTTFFGLAPMILETSVQARFLIPMAVSLGFGVMFATFITLLLVPAAYLIVEDARRGLHKLAGTGRPSKGAAPGDGAPPTA